MPRARKLTRKQKEVLDFLVLCQAEGRAPTFREIGDEFGIDVKSAYQRVRKLEELGHVQRLGGHRGLKLTAEPGPSAPAGQVPIVGRVAAGAPTLAVENIEGYVALPEFFGSPLDIPAMLLQSLLNKFFLVVINQFKLLSLDNPTGKTISEILWKVLGRDILLSTKDEGVFNHIFELANISRIIVVEKNLHG